MMRKGDLVITTMILVVLGLSAVLIAAVINPQIFDRATAVIDWSDKEQAELSPEAVKKACDSRCFIYCANNANTEDITVTVDDVEVQCDSADGAGEGWSCEC